MGETHLVFDPGVNSATPIEIEAVLKGFSRRK